LDNRTQSRYIYAFVPTGQLCSTPNLIGTDCSRSWWGYRIAGMADNTDIYDKGIKKRRTVDVAEEMEKDIPDGFSLVKKLSWHEMLMLLERCSPYEIGCCIQYGTFTKDGVCWDDKLNDECFFDVETNCIGHTDKWYSDNMWESDDYHEQVLRVLRRL
jgi:hypothetical protein